MTGLPRILSVITLALVLAPRAFAQVAGDPLLQTGILTLPVGAAPSRLADGSSQIYGGYTLSPGSVQFMPSGSSADTLNGNSQSIAGDLRAEELLLSAGYQQTSTTLTDDSSITTTKAVNTAGILGFGADVGETGAVSATVAALYTRVAVDSPVGSSSATSSFYDLAAGFSVDVREHYRVGANFSPAVSNSSAYGGILAGQILKVGHGDAYTVGIARNDPVSSFAVDLYDSAENKSADSPHTQGYLFVGRYLLSDVRWFGDLMILGELNSFTSDQLIDGSNFSSPKIQGRAILGGVFWRTDPWVLGFQYAQQTQSGSNFGNSTLDATRFDSSTVYQYSFTFLRKLGK